MTVIYQPEQIKDWISLADQPTTINRLVTPFTVEEVYPWQTGEIVLYLGEVYGMKNHGIFVGKDGLVKFGYHLDSFRIIPEEDL